MSDDVFVAKVGGDVGSWLAGSDARLGSAYVGASSDHRWTYVRMVGWVAVTLLPLLTIGAVEGEAHPVRQFFVLWPLTAVALVALAGLRTWWWSRGVGSVSYEVADRELLVRRRGEVVKRFPRESGDSIVDFGFPDWESTFQIFIWGPDWPQGELVARDGAGRRHLHYLPAMRIWGPAAALRAEYDIRVGLGLNVDGYAAPIPVPWWRRLRWSRTRQQDRRLAGRHATAPADD